MFVPTTYIVLKFHPEKVFVLLSSRMLTTAFLSRPPFPEKRYVAVVTQMSLVSHLGRVCFSEMIGSAV